MTIAELRRHRDAVLPFHNVYVAYLEAGPHGDRELRAKVVDLTPAAQTALVAAGVHPVLYPPRMVGGR